MKKILFIFLFILSKGIYSQVVLSADGAGNTYELINSVLALPNRDVVEVPDCNHTTFGRHIDEAFDTELNKNVFRFHIHVTPDNDRCKVGVNDRQRNEIKTSGGSPANLIATEGETVQYKWKFKLSSTFKPSSSFTHIHQIKSVGGSFSSTPLYTLTLRKGNPDQLELRHAEFSSQSTLKKTDLTPFKGTWVEANETITYGVNKSYHIEIKRISDGVTLFNYSNSSIGNWQSGADFARPKWGIYRSLNNKQDLQDEIVLYADFSIEENPNTLSTDINIQTLKNKSANILLFPNPSSNSVTLKNANTENYNTLEMYDYRGKRIDTQNRISKNKLDVSNLAKGLYFIVLKKDTLTTKVLKCYVK